MTAQPDVAAPTNAEKADTLDRLLRLAASERDARNSLLWKTNPESAFRAHDAACERVWDALYHLLDERTRIGMPVQKQPKKPDPRAQLKNEIIKRLREDLPQFLNSILEEYEVPE